MDNESFLKIIENILMYLALVLVLVAFGFSAMLDEAENIAGALTAFTLISVMPSTVLLINVVVGILLEKSKNDLARRVGLGLALSTFVVMLGVSIPLLGNEDGFGYSVLIVLIAAICYLLAVLVRGIMAIVRLAKPLNEDTNDPYNDKNIQELIKWKKFCDDGIITKDEFEAKRARILGVEAEEK